MTAAILNTTTLGKMVGYSLVSGVGIAVVFGAGVSGAAGVLEALRQKRTAATVGWAVLSIACLLGAVAAVVLGIVVMSTKG